MAAPGRLALATGGGGFIGGHLCEGLLAAGWCVRVLDDLSSERERNLAALADRLEFIEADVCDGARLDTDLEGVDVVFRHAAVASVARSIEDPEHSHRVNLTGSLAVLQCARRAGVRRPAYASSASAHGAEPGLPTRESAPARPASPYALQKYAGELYCRLYHSLYAFETVALCNFNLSGPRQDPASDYAEVVPSFARACLDGERPRVYGDGEQPRDFVMVEDAVQANLLAADAAGPVETVCNVAAGRRIGLNERLGHLAELPDQPLEPLHGTPRPRDVGDSEACRRRARVLQDYEARVEFPEGLSRTLAVMSAADSECAEH